MDKYGDSHEEKEVRSERRDDQQRNDTYHYSHSYGCSCPKCGSSNIRRASYIDSVVFKRGDYCENCGNEWW